MRADVLSLLLLVIACAATTPPGDDACNGASPSEDAAALLQHTGPWPKPLEPLGFGKWRADGHHGPAPRAAYFPQTPPVPEGPPATCTISESEKCSLHKMRGPTVVSPGGKTQCIAGGAYSFLVVPGHWDKLLFLFEGGGACWEANGALGKVVVEACTPSIEQALQISSLGAGILNKSNPENPFSHYTVVEVLYCSGDAHVGNSSMVNGDGKVLTQKGYYNSMAAIDWTKANTAPLLHQLTIGGTSAGALGTVAWADYLLGRFVYKSAAVFADSYVSLFPAGTEASTWRSWRACETPNLSSLCKIVENGDLTGAEVFSHAMQRHRSVAFGSIQSKADATQIYFYQALAQSWGNFAALSITPAQFYSDSLAIFRKWNENSNYVVYFVEGQQHVFTGLPSFYTAGAAGPANQAPNTPSLRDWTEGLVWHNVQTVCYGEVAATAPLPDATTWCDSALLPKKIKPLFPPRSASVAA